ncbi:type IV pilus modification protein PilV [Caenimonas terrae]|uniref:Type IV pilus modification protein PilV n=1 Tax=Caenimonas terrae TaxID=696074 RepID=A0ABW0NJ95_9BURK
MRKSNSFLQQGSSLIEVLVTILILSFGMLSLAGMMAYAVQMPKLSGYRATAMMLGASHVERMRANIAGFTGGAYNEAMTFNTVLATSNCVYPSCDAVAIASLDKAQSNAEMRRELPLGGMRMVCNGACTSREGDLWILWQEPSTFAAINNNNDECPASGTYTGTPRCIHIRFKL